MIYAYIGAALIVGLLIGVIALAVYWMAGKVSQDINRKTRQLISAYDEILEEKSREIARLSADVPQGRREWPSETVYETEKSPAAAGSAAFVKAADIMNTTTYLDGSVSTVYRTIRDGVNVNPLDALRRYAPYVFEPGHIAVSGSAAEDLLGKLDYETVYELSLLPEDVQLKVLFESLSGEEKELLTKYMQDRNTFGIIAFCDDLKTIAAEYSKVPTIYVPRRDAVKRFPAGVRVVIDDDICEGFRLETDNKLYDYSVRGREIS